MMDWLEDIGSLLLFLLMTMGVGAAVLLLAGGVLLLFDLIAVVSLGAVQLAFSSLLVGMLVFLAIYLWTDTI